MPLESRKQHSNRRASPGISPRMKLDWKSIGVTALVVVGVIFVLKAASSVTSQIPVVGPYLQV